MIKKDEMFFRFSFIIFAVLLVSMIVLQIFSRTQIKKNIKLNRLLKETKEQINLSESKLSSYVRPEILKNNILTISPSSKTIKFNQTISINDL